MRNKFSEFTTAAQNGNTVVTAQPASSVDEPVRFDGSIAERGSSDEPEANWEEIVSTLAQSHLGDQLAINDGRGVMDREDAVEALVDADTEQVKNEHAAHAVIEYLADQDVLSLEDDDVVLLMGYDDIRESGSSAMLNNWAAALDTCVERIEAAVNRVEENQETLESHLEQLETPSSVKQDYEQKQAELKQEMQSMLGGKKPSELEGDELEAFERKRERFHRYEAMAESIESGPGGETIDAPQMLARLKEDLLSLQRALNEQSADFRRIALVDSIEGSGAREMVENLTGVVAQIGDAMDPKDRMDQTSNDEFVEATLNMSESISEADLEADTSREAATNERR